MVIIIICENKDETIKFHNKIKAIFEQNRYDNINKKEVLKFIKKAEWPRFDIEPSKEINNQYPYYCLSENYTELAMKLNVSKITGCNVSETLRNRFEMYSNRVRVENAIPYILGIEEESCKPIDVHKINDNYYINDGKHRFYAHLLLNIEEIPVIIKEYTYDIEKSYIELISDEDISFNLFDGKKHYKKHFLTHSDYLKGETYSDIKDLLKLGIKVFKK